MDKIKRAIPLILICLAFGAFFYFKLYQYLSFNALKQNRQFLLQWTAEHYLLAVIIFMGIYTLCVAISIPGAVYLTLAGGFIFGILPGTLYVVISATLGALLLYLAMSTALKDIVAKNSSKWLQKMERGFRENAFSYLLVLRLVPLFPFWMVNIAAALLRVPLRTFLITTFFGIMPGAFVYNMVGNGLGAIFDSQQTPDLNIIFTPKVLFPLLALACLSLIPIFYKRCKKNESV